MKKLLALITLFAATLVLSGQVYASGQSNCQIVYGGGEVCREQVKFTINKLVQKPGKGGEFVENLSANDSRYGAGQNVNFKIVIENTGDRDIENLNVVDRFPEFLSFVSGVGNASVGAKEVNFVIGKLEKGKKVEYVITAKAADAGQLPNQAITCVINNVKAVASDGSQAQDNSQVCIEKNITATPTPVVFEKQPIKKIPATGPEMAYLFGLVPAGAAGLYLRRKSN